MKRTDRETIAAEAERLERIARALTARPVSKPVARFEAAKLRAVAAKLRGLIVS